MIVRPFAGVGARVPEDAVGAPAPPPPAGGDAVRRGSAAPTAATAAGSPHWAA